MGSARLTIRPLRGDLLGQGTKGQRVLHPCDLMTPPPIWIAAALCLCGRWLSGAAVAVRRDSSSRGVSVVFLHRQIFKILNLWSIVSRGNRGRGTEQRECCSLLFLTPFPSSFTLSFFVHFFSLFPCQFPCCPPSLPSLLKFLLPSVKPSFIHPFPHHVSFTSFMLTFSSFPPSSLLYFLVSFLLLSLLVFLFPSLLQPKSSSPSFIIPSFFLLQFLHPFFLHLFSFAFYFTLLHLNYFSLLPLLFSFFPSLFFIHSSFPTSVLPHILLFLYFYPLLSSQLYSLFPSSLHPSFCPSFFP